ncbi:MAG: outer membrane protein transport protein [Acidobacteriota bacterium]|nr:outer membrane protein transport protein [Acidobacteriota bacterium]
MRKTIIALAVALALPAAAQNVDIEALSGLQFNFGNPGARSLGMGGAFLGLADDASAAEANPAGLTILRKTEVSVEGRNYVEEQAFSTSGTFPAIQRTAFQHHSDRVVVSFASAVFPIRNKFTVGVYYHEPLHNEGGGVVQARRDEFTGDVIPTPTFYLPTEGSSIDTVRFVGDPITRAECLQRRQTTKNPFSCLQYNIDPFVSALSVRQRTLGVAGAWQVHPKFSIGVTAREQRLLESAATFRFSSTPVVALKQSIIQATARERNGQVDLAEERDLTFTVGFKWAPSDKISFGGVYKQGPNFETSLFYADANTGNEFITAAKTSFHIPDVAGLGVSVRPIAPLTVNFDAVHVKYSNLVDNFVAATADVSDLENPFSAADVTELHLGAEYLFPTKIPIALRAGYWTDPAHSVTWNGPLNHPSYVAEALLFPEGEDQTHMSIGAGIALQRFQIDLAYDTADTYKVGSISVVTRF